MKPTLFISIMLFFLATTSMGQNDKNQEPGRRKLQEEMNAYINKSNREFNEFADRRKYTSPNGEWMLGWANPSCTTT